MTLLMAAALQATYVNKNIPNTSAAIVKAAVLFVKESLPAHPAQTPGGEYPAYVTHPLAGQVL